MPKILPSTLTVALALSAVACSSVPTQGLQSAAEGAADIKAIEFSGTGRWFQFGQAPNPDSAWPSFELKKYVADIDYSRASAKVDIARLQIVEPGRLRPAPVEQRVVQYIKGNTAWNIAATGNAPPAPSAQPLAVEERKAEIWATPQGFLKAALINNASSKPANGGTDISFTVGDKYRYVGHLNANNQVEQVQTWIDNPILGDTLVETRFSDYKDFGGVQFPAHITRSQGGFPVLDLNVSEVKAIPALNLNVPPKAAKAPPVVVKADELAKDVYYLTGGSHHSVAIGQKDHVVVVEAPLNEERSLAVIAKTKELFPGKPIKYLVNSHAHFDHSGGLRTYVDEGATIVTHQTNQAYYEKVWAAPHTIKPDHLSQSNKAAQFESFTDQYVLTDGKRPIEIHSIAGNGHNDAFVLVYLPNEKVLVEADAFTQPAANATPPASPNPYSVNLLENIQRLNLDVAKIAGLHGPRVATLSDLRAYIGQPVALK